MHTLNIELTEDEFAFASEMAQAEGQTVEEWCRLQLSMRAKTRFATSQQVEKALERSMSKFDEAYRRLAQ